MGGYAVAFTVAVLVTTALIPVCILLAKRYHVIAQPDRERRLHKKPTPQLGGLAMCVGMLIALAVASVIPQFREMFEVSSGELLGVALAAVIITVIGIVDDVIEVSPPAKLAGMVLAGSVLYWRGVTVSFFQVPFRKDVVILSPDLIPLVTVLWVIGMANAINLIDGLDGLAAGIVAIGSAAFFLYGDRLFDAGRIDGTNYGQLVAAIVCGVCVGFLPWNWTPAKIFMGDAGAMLLGLLLASSTMIVGGRATEGSTRQTYFFFAPLIIPFVILAVPFFDTALAFARRTARGKSFHVADRHHLHHRLLELGHGPRRAVAILWACTAILSAFVLVPSYVESRLALAPVGVALACTVGFAATNPDLRRERRERRQALVDQESRRD